MRLLSMHWEDHMGRAMTDDDKDMLFILGLFIGWVIVLAVGAGLWALIR